MLPIHAQSITVAPDEAWGGVVMNNGDRKSTPGLAREKFTAKIKIKMKKKIKRNEKKMKV